MADDDLSDTCIELSNAQRRRRDVIISAALDIFDRDGFEAARMIDIAEAAGVAKGTLYLYFKTKEDMLEGMIGAIVLPTVEKLQTAAGTQAESATLRLHRQLQTLAEHLSRGEMLKILRLMVAYGPQRKKLRTFYFENVVAPNMEAIGETLKDGAKYGEFSAKAADFDVMLLAAPFVMAAVWKILFQDFSELNEESLFMNAWSSAVDLLEIREILILN